MSLKPAIIYDDGRVYVEFTFEKFVELFQKYFNECGVISETLHRIENDLREETKYVK